MATGEEEQLQVNNIEEEGDQLSSSPLLPGDSHMPYEDSFLENLTETPVDLFVEKPWTKNPDDPPLKKILFWNDVST